VPQYTIDAPGGGGKVPINPDYVESVTEDEIVFRNYEGKRYRYPLKSTPRQGVDGALQELANLESIIS
jgi:lysine 2,3-aminomutase